MATSEEQAAYKRGIQDASFSSEDLSIIVAALGNCLGDPHFCTQTSLFPNCQDEKEALVTLHNRLSTLFRESL